MAAAHTSAPTWSDRDILREQDSPIPPYSTCVASRSFKGKEAHDLPFVKGEVLTIIEPCNVVFWYLAENKKGQRGIIPITHVKVQSLVPQAHQQSSHSPPKPPEQQHQAPPSPWHSSHPPSSTHPSHPPTNVHPPSPLASHPPTSTPPHSPSRPPTSTPPPLPSKPAPRSPSHPHTSTAALKPLLPPKPARLSHSLPRQLRPHAQQLTRSTSTESPMPHPPDLEAPPTTHSPSTTVTLDLPSPSDNIDTRPPAPLPQEAVRKREEPVTLHRPGKYRTKDEFINKSGWFAPTVDNCLCQKTNMQMPAFRAVKHGVFYFQHKREQRLKYVGRSHNVYESLITMYHRLFELPDRSLSPMEVELKYYHPDASEWIVRVHPCRQPEDLDLEETKFLMMHRTLQPEGLNRELVFQSREHFYAFAEWYAGFRRSSVRSLFYPQAKAAGRRNRRPGKDTS